VIQALEPKQPPEGYTFEDIERRHGDTDRDDDRSRFERDHDRLIHSPALRRLQGKTQVVTPGEADFFRTRLTHSLEVAQVARRLAQRVGANRDLCESSALLHDLGHPPFAHIGEETLSDALDATADAWGIARGEVGGFNGNAQSFRLAVKSLSHSSRFKGLDLTRGVLDGAVKYPWERDRVDAPASDENWCFFPTERDDAEWVRRGVVPKRSLEKSFEAQVVDWADDVAYSIHDVEDWYRAGYMPLEMIIWNDEARQGFGRGIATKLANDVFSEADVRNEVEVFFTHEGFKGIKGHYDGTSDAKEGIRVMRRFLFDEFTDVEAADKSAPPTRHNNTLVVDPLRRLRSRILKRLLTRYVLSHPRMATYEEGQARVIRELVARYVEVLQYDKAAGRLGDKARLGIFPPDMQGDVRDAADNPPELLRLVADHIAGMTDGYAIRLHARLTGVGIGSFNEFV
jgi:dGTPase